MKRKEPNPNECFHCGKPVAADKPDAVRWDYEGSPIYCDRVCWEARREANEREELRKTAIHESGHCLGARLAGSVITEATIVPKGDLLRGGSLGHIKSTTVLYEDSIIENLMGHAAELEFDIVNDGHGLDYAHAQKEIREMLKSKRSEKLSIPRFEWDVPGYKPWMSRTNAATPVKEWRKQMQVKKSEWKPEFDRYVRKARRLAKKYRAWIEQVAELLLKHKTLTDEQIPQLEATTVCSTSGSDRPTPCTRSTQVCPVSASRTLSLARENGRGWRSSGRDADSKSSASSRRSLRCGRCLRVGRHGSSRSDLS